MQLADLDINQLYTYADYSLWKFEERVELIKGKLFPMSPAPNQYHQFLVGKFYLRLGVFLEWKSCKIFLAPFDVRLPRKTNNDQDIITVLQPDLCVICDPAKLADPRGCLGAPDIVIEILSPSDSKKELKFKYEVYEEAGVKEYWVVFAEERALMIYKLINGTFQPSKPLVSGDVVTTEILPGFSLRLEDIFGED